MTQAQTSCDHCDDDESSHEIQFFSSTQILRTLTPIAGFFLAVGFLGSLWLSPGWSTLFYSLSILFGGVFVARSAVRGLLKQRFLNISFLVTIASVGAIYIGEYGEAAAVIFLFSVAEFLESYGVERSKRAVAALMERSPKVARLLDGSTVPVEEVSIGTIVAIRPGEQVPLDGTVLKGTSTVDEAAITGESVPVEKTQNTKVFAGTMNVQGYLEVRVDVKSTNSLFARIIALVKKAQASRAPTEAFIEKFARYYTPLIVVCAILVVSIPTLFFNQPFDEWLYRALVLLVVACPCALVISTPVAIASAIGGASRHGVLIKGGEYLERLAGIKAIAFDKTRTLTYGRHEVTDVLVFGSHTKEEIIADAAGLEQLSSHPLAEAIVAYAKQHNITPHEMHDYQNVAGKGGRGECMLCSAHSYIGNTKLMKEYGIDDSSFLEQIVKLEKEGKTVVIVAEGTEVIGAIGIADVLREESSEVVRTLETMGVSSSMLTGDNIHSAQAVGTQLSITDVRAALSPEDKVEAIQEIRKTVGAVAMVGDGINDAPSLATADVSFAIGAGGTDVALESADIALIRGDLTTIPYSLTLARRAMRIIRTNVSMAIGIKVLFLALVMTGTSNLVFAIAADSGMALIVIVNSLRLFSTK